MLIRSQNVRMNRLDLSDVAYISDEVDAGMKRSVVHPNDVLLNITGASIGRVAHFDLKSTRANVNQHVCILRPVEKKLDARYLAYWLSSPDVQHNIHHRQQHGGTRQALTFAQIAEFSIPLPPLAEQKRIAAILDKADAVRRKRQRAIQLVCDARRSVLLASLGLAANHHLKPQLHGSSDYLPAGFTWSRLDELCDTIADIDHNMPKAVDEGIPFISPKDIRDDEEICFENAKHISVADFERLSRKIKPRRNDIVYSRIGARLGKARLVRVDFDFLASYSCCIIRPISERIHPLFLTAYLDSVVTRRQANLDTQSIAVPDLGLAKIKAFLVPVPPRRTQLHIAAAIEKLDRSLSQLRHLHARSDDLFNSLVQRAFRGEL